MTNKMAIIYRRVSTKAQKDDGTSLDKNLTSGLS